MLPTWNEPYGSPSLRICLKREPGKREVFSRVDQWKCENCTHVHEKMCRTQTTTFSIRTRQSNWLLLWKHAFTGKRVPVRVIPSRTLSTSLLLPFFFKRSCCAHIHRNCERKGKSSRTYFGNLKKKNLAVFLKILLRFDISSSMLIPAGPIAYSQAFLMWC